VQRRFEHTASAYWVDLKKRLRAYLMLETADLFSDRRFAGQQSRLAAQENIAFIHILNSDHSARPVNSVYESIGQVF
jgi:hypothetical protein